MSPGDLEHLIECYRLAGTLEPDSDCRQWAFQRMANLIAKRDPETIARMEAAKGLR